MKKNGKIERQLGYFTWVKTGSDDDAHCFFFEHLHTFHLYIGRIV